MEALTIDTKQTTKPAPPAFGSPITPPNRDPELSVVIPCYNEGPDLEALILHWWNGLSKHAPNFEIVAINDGSNDGTGRILDNLRRIHREIRVIHQLRLGHSNAIRRGYEASRGRYVLQTDPDPGYRVHEFLEMWDQRKSHHLILTARSSRGMHHSWLSSWLRLLFSVEIHDPDVPFRLFSQVSLRAYLARLPKDSLAPNLSLTTLIKANYPEQVTELTTPVTPRKRPTHKLWSQFRKSVKLALELLRLRLSPLSKTLPFAPELSSA